MFYLGFVYLTIPSIAQTIQRRNLTENFCGFPSRKMQEYGIKLGNDHFHILSKLLLTNFPIAGHSGRTV
jgi:hypothetical protein